MYRFVALSWNVKDSAGTAAAQRLVRRLRSSSPDWQSVLDLPGFRVFHAPQPGGARHAYVLKRDAGVILGKLFDGGTEDHRIPADPTFDERESERIVGSQGRRVIERYWGHYVAFLQAPQGDRRFVLRDPTGGLPCFMMRLIGIDVFFSDMEDCVRLGSTPFVVDWDHLTAFFLYSELTTRTTGVRDVTQLYAGECAAIAEDGTMSRSFHWNPVDVSEAGTIENPDEARRALGAVIRRCIDAWTSSYTSILQELSGGLDSSIVTACLGKARTRTNILCFHFCPETPQRNERAYARAAAHSAGCELVEATSRVSATSLERQLDRSRVASPAVLGFVPPSERLRRRLVAERQVGAVFTGQGGDHLFQQGSSKLIAAEYAQRHGLRPDLLRIVTDTSRMTRQSVWSVFSTVVAHGLLGRSFDPYSDYERAPSILSTDARAAVRRNAYSHPWVENAGRLPGSKTQQVFNVVGCQTYYLRPCRYAELIHPLISQPIIERCLQIPSYVLAHRGKSRGLVREAFAADVPARIIQRYSKGSTSHYFSRMLAGNAAFVRAFLLDGALVREGILDRYELEKQLSERELLRGGNVRSLLDAVRAEAWLSAWSGVRKRVAA